MLNGVRPADEAARPARPRVRLATVAAPAPAAPPARRARTHWLPSGPSTTRAGAAQYPAQVGFEVAGSKTTTRSPVRRRRCGRRAQRPELRGPSAPVSHKDPSATITASWPAISHRDQGPTRFQRTRAAAGRPGDGSLELAAQLAKRVRRPRQRLAGNAGGVNLAEPRRPRAGSARTLATCC